VTGTFLGGKLLHYVDVPGKSLDNEAIVNLLKTARQTRVQKVPEVLQIFFYEGLNET